MRNRSQIFRIVALLLFGYALYGCANIGTPEGGPRDYVPPRLVKANPPMDALNVNKNKIELTFDEVVNLKDQQKKVSVSPAQRQAPIIRALGKKVTVELRDTLMPKTTYVVDFADAIEDNNEGNPLEDFCYAFSTGADLDTLQVSGMVLRASDLEPMQHVLVGLHSNLSDTAFATLPLERVARTNSKGEFTLRNLRPGRYRIFALNDVDGNQRWALSEDMAWVATPLTPSTRTFTSTDTIFTFDHRVDTVLPTAEHTEYLPNDVLLSMFNEQYRSHYLDKAERVDARRLYVKLSAPPDTAPRLRLLAPQQRDGDDWFVRQHNAGGDSLFYWLVDSALVAADSLTVELTYLRSDSTDRLCWRTDTLQLAQRRTNAQIKAAAQAEKDRQHREKRVAQLLAKQQAGKTLSDDEAEELAEATRVHVEKLKVETDKSGLLEVTDSIGLKFEEPLARLDPAGLHLAVKRDTLWVPLPPPAPPQTSAGNPLRYVIPMALQADSTYRLSVDSLAAVSLYGIGNDPVEFEFKVRAEEEYAMLRLVVNAPDGSLLQLLDASETVVLADTVKAGAATLRHILPATYYLRIILDANHNGRWDTGDYGLGVQPEQVCYFPKPLRLRRNWDVEQQWDIFATPLDRQKPDAIKHNKPEDRSKLAKKQPRGTGEPDEDDDEFNSNGFGNNVYSGNRYQDYQNSRKR